MSHYRPLPDELVIAKSDYLSNITGNPNEMGLFATEDIPSGTKWLTHLKTNDDSFEDNLIRLPMGGFFNHDSKNPNCRVIHTHRSSLWFKVACLFSKKTITGYIHLETLRDIKIGEELTAQYTLYNPENQ